MIGKDIVSMAGSPAYIFSEHLFKKRIESVRSAFGEKVDLCFSIKANPFLLQLCGEDFQRVEVCSPGEFEICRHMGILPEKILYSGVNKGKKDIHEVISYGVKLLTAESRRQMALIDEAAAELGRKVQVLLRLADDSQFGMDESDAVELIAGRDKYRGIDIRGIHYFTGTLKTRPSMIISELEYVEGFVSGVEGELGFHIKEIEYGTGLAVDHFSRDAEMIEEERLMGISDAVRKLGGRCHLTIEMGRFFAAPCGFYINEITDIKKNGDISYIICDGGLHQLKYDGQVRGLKMPVITHFRRVSEASPEADSCRTLTGPDSSAYEGEQTYEEVSSDNDGSEEIYTLCGSLCTTEDVMVRDVPLKHPAIGDRLVFGHTGAYAAFEGMSTFLSRDMPRIWLLRESGQFVLLRDRIDTWIFNTPEGMQI